MITTLAQADAEMAALFKEAWAYPCLWPNGVAVDVTTEPVWAHWSLSYTGGGQLSFGPVGRRKFSKTGNVVIVVFTEYGKGLGHSRAIAETALQAYEGKKTPGGVVFNNVRIESEGQGETENGNVGWWATAVVAPFSYEHLR